VSGTAPAGALITTASDLARFGLAILGGGELDGARILSRESVAEMTRVQARAHPRMRMGFGLGFGVIEEPSRTRVWWDGSLAGAASRLMLVPERGVGVAILSNLGDNGPVNVAADRILELLAPQTSPVLSAGAPGDESAVPGTYRFTDAVDPSVRYLEWLANARVTRDERGVWLDSPIARSPALLVPAGDGSFTIGGRSVLTGAPALFDGDRLYLGFLEARRIPLWQSARALAVYAGIAVLALVVSLVRLALRFFRSRRRAGAV
jgi:hypothetical protein